MASNTFAGGTTDDTIIFDKPVDYLNIFVGTGVTFALSLDKGNNFISLPAGFHSFRISAIKEVQVEANGAWQLIGVQGG